MYPEALTQASPGQSTDEHEAAAGQNFRNLLVCMGDRPAQVCQRKASEDAIVLLARTVPAMRDEVYVQVMKQLTRNASSRSLHLGWQLLNRLCQQAHPSGELAEFVRAFIQNEIERVENESTVTVTTAIQTTGISFHLRLGC